MKKMSKKEKVLERKYDGLIKKLKERLYEGYEEFRNTKKIEREYMTTMYGSVILTQKHPRTKFTKPLERPNLERHFKTEDPADFVEMFEQFLPGNETYDPGYVSLSSLIPYRHLDKSKRTSVFYDKFEEFHTMYNDIYNIIIKEQYLIDFEMIQIDKSVKERVKVIPITEDGIGASIKSFFFGVESVTLGATIIPVDVTEENKRLDLLEERFRYLRKLERELLELWVEFYKEWANPTEEDIEDGLIISKEKYDDIRRKVALEVAEYEKRNDRWAPEGFFDNKLDKYLSDMYKTALNRKTQKLHKEFKELKKLVLNQNNKNNK